MVIVGGKSWNVLKVKNLGRPVCDTSAKCLVVDTGYAPMNFDKITIDDLMEFLDIEEHTRKSPEVRATVQKFMNVYLPMLEEDPKFIEFYERRYGDESH